MRLILRDDTSPTGEEEIEHVLTVEPLFSGELRLRAQPGAAHDFPSFVSSARLLRIEDD